MSRGGRLAYFATARLTHIEPDPGRPDHYYALVAGYLDFSRPVPYREGEITYERALTKADGSTNKGAFGRSVRNISDAEYDLILQAGFARTIDEVQRLGARPAAEGPDVSDRDQQAFDRPIVERLVARPFRDAAFAVAVKAAYQDTCAITDIRMINGSGRSEVQAAHIQPVAHRGPDSVRNGLALSGTLHWMFDRGLVSVADDFRLLVARDRVPDTVARLLRPEGTLRLPPKPELHPAPAFLRYHREHIFKG
jgi:putative restriction endonuclease